MSKEAESLWEQVVHFTRGAQLEAPSHDRQKQDWKTGLDNDIARRFVILLEISYGMTKRIFVY